MRVLDSREQGASDHQRVPAILLRVRPLTDKRKQNETEPSAAYYNIASEKERFRGCQSLFVDAKLSMIRGYTLKLGCQSLVVEATL